MRSTAALGSHRWGYYFSDRHKENIGDKMKEAKEFKTKSAAGKYAYGVYRNYGFDASVFEVTNKKTGKKKYAVINPRAIGMKRL